MTLSHRPARPVSNAREEGSKKEKGSRGLSKGWPRKTALALACVALCAPASADITGYTPDSENFPFDCSSVAVTCEAGMSKLDTIHRVRLVACKTWAASGPAKCLDWSLNEGSGGSVDAYGLDAQALANRAFTAWKAFQASQDLAAQASSHIATRLGPCIDSVNVGRMLKVCSLYARKVIGDGSSENPHRLGDEEFLSDLNRIAVNEANPGPVCSNHVPGLGCPTSTASRDTTPVANSCSPAADPAAVVPQEAVSKTVGDPISVITGAVTESRQDLSWPIEFSRAYASNRTSAGELGNWRHSHESSLAVATASGPSGRFDAGLVFSLEDGSEVVFTRTASTSAFAPTFADQKTMAVTAVAQGYELSLPSGEKRVYAGSGKMLSRSFPSGYFLTYSHDGAGRLASITDAYARGLDFAYEGSSRKVHRVSTVGGASSDAVEYAYDGEKLLSASFNAGSPQIYEYEASGKLLRMVDELGAVSAQFEYDPTTGKALSSRRFSSPGVETEATTLSYGSGAVTVSQGGADSVYSTSRDSSNLKSRVASATVGGSATNYTVGYASSGSGGHPISFKVGTMNDAYTVNSTTRLPSKLTRATGGTETYTWVASLRKLQTVVDTSPQGTRTKQFDYDAQGNMLSMTITPGAGAARAWSWTYGTMGKPLTATGPDGSQTVYEYYPDNDLVSLARRGQLKSSTNALGHKTEITEYDERGRSTRVLDPNGVSSEMSYDDRGRLLSWSRAGVSRSMAYDAAGQLKTLSLSNGHSASFDYDGAGRLVRVSDNRGDEVEFDYDEHGNAIKTSLSQGSSLVLELNRTFDALGQVLSSWAADPSKARSQTFDANGRVKTAKDGLGRSSSYNYANSGGMSSYAEPGSSATMGRDVDDNPTTHASSGVSTTTYAWNDFGEILSVGSPDSGPQTYVHNAQNRTRSMTDAAGILHTSTFDALGRLVSATHAGAALGSISETYAYDTGRLGLPDSVTDASGTTSWTWNEFDLPATKTRVVDGVSLTMTYGYDEHGQLTSQTYPSGMVVEYVREMGRVVSVKVNGAVFISGIQYRPFSNEPVSWAWAAGGSRVKTFDAEGMPSGILDAGLTQAVAFDAVGRVASLTGPGFSMIPSYSAADQLAGVNVGGQTQTFTFNTNLNRLTKKTFAGPVVATPITSNTNLHSTISDPTPPALSASFAYDARKNMTFNGRVTMSYDLKGNLATAVGGGVSASYAYNAFSQRVKKTVGAVYTHFTYDESGNLAGEYSSSGARQAEHIYLGGLPIGVMFGSGPAQPMRVHADYLGTPRAITNGSTVMWKWEPTDPFGANLPSVQGVVYNPRFPGQHYDAETNLHYNHHRTYDPALGRYVQPDPIGLAGGKNPFNYANQNPLNAVDPEGLSSWPSFGPDGEGFDFSINGRDNPVRQVWMVGEKKLKVRGPDYISGSVSIYVFSASIAINSCNGNVYHSLGFNRSYPSGSYTPSFSLVAGSITEPEVDGDRVDKFLKGGATQASFFVPMGNPYIGVGGGVSHSYGGDTAIEYGFGVPGVSNTPITYGTMMNSRKEK